MKRKIAAILAADIAGYSLLVARDEEDTLARLASYREVFDDFVGKAGGRIFNTAGDSVMAEFSSSVEATRCAIDVQESIRTRNLGYPQSRQMLYRIGLTIGDVVERGGDLLGDGVNIAARLESLAEPGGICVSQSVYEQVAAKLSVPFRDLGMQEVKNLPQPVHAFRVDMGGAKVSKAPEGRAAIKDKIERSGGVSAPMLIGVAGLLLGGAAMTTVLLRGPAPIAPQPAPAQLVEDQPKPAAVAEAPKPTVVIAEQSPPEAPKGTIIPPGATPAEAFAILARSGGIVQGATTAPELYHNARSFESRGDSASARRDYLALAALGGDAIDPHLRFAALLRAQDGRAGAREIYAGLADKAPGRAAALAYALQFDGAERRKRLEDFVAAQQDYAPAQYLLSRDYSDDDGGSRTISDKRREATLLQTFLASEADGKLAPFFLDQSMLSEWVDRARKREAALKTYLDAATLAPTASFMRSNSGWSAAISLPEPATALAWRMNGAGEFSATGLLATTDSRTGRPMPNPSFELPGNVSATTIDLRYDDASGRTQGPFSIRFDPRIELVKGQRDILERFSNTWVAFGSGSPRNDLLYYTQLMSYRCAIAKAEIGIGDAQPNVELAMPACNERDPNGIPSDAKPYVTVPTSVKSVKLRLTWRDGGQSEVKTFWRP
jgi:class 3 adenylate cyclase